MLTAKEKQKEFKKTFLNSLLKQNGYLTTGQTWWKDKGDFFNVINLQNYSWNTKDKIDFRFNIGIAIKAIVKDEQKKKATYNDLIVHLTEDYFLPEGGKNNKYRDNEGYSISSDTDLNYFIREFKNDFDTFVLPSLEKPKTLQDCLKYYGEITFWGKQLKKIIKEQNLL